VPDGKLGAAVTDSTRLLALHKDHVDTLDFPDLLATLGMFEPIDANPVFVLFRRRPETKWSRHLDAFGARLRNHAAGEARSPATIAVTPSMAAPRASVYVGENTALTRTIYGRKLFVDTRDISITPHLLLDGFWEPWVTAVIMRRVRPGMRVLDVGANCGYYAVLMADLVGEAGHVTAFEPHPGMARLLRRNLEANGLDGRVVAVEKALADRPGRVTLSVYRHHGGEGTLRTDGLVSEISDELVSIEVEAITFDEYCGTHETPDFIKMDIEGGEPAAIEGALGVLSRTPHLEMVMEFSVCWIGTRSRAEAFLHRIEGLGFTLRIIDHTGDLRTPDINEVFGGPVFDLFLSQSP
jgi:FkbM family methyltransferase